MCSIRSFSGRPLYSLTNKNDQQYFFYPFAAACAHPVAACESEFSVILRNGQPTYIILYTMSLQVDNNAFELVTNTTPNKRKREYPNDGLCVLSSGFGVNKENHFVYNNFMEVKSIADIFAQKKDAPHIQPPATGNPFEVSRKPPKKKTKRDEEIGCFENAALNLNGPEKVVNPFEVKREAVVPARNEHCFVNSGLNLRGAEREIPNPFEIAREPVVVPARDIQGGYCGRVTAHRAILCVERVLIIIILFY